MTRLSFAPLLLLILTLQPAVALHAFVISEIHYNPASDNNTLEFIEITNNTLTPEDLSGHNIVEGVAFSFPQGTILDAHGILVICANEDAVRTLYGIENTIGDFSGRLDGNGERITFVNQVGVPVSSMAYRDEGQWPVGPDGTGHTLVIKSLYADPAEPESWTRSPTIGGSPGAPNFGVEEEHEFEVHVYVDEGDEWHYARGLEAFSDPPDAWRENDFDDASWDVGPSGFGFGDSNENTLLDDMQGNYTSLAIRIRFDLTRDEAESPGEYFLGVNFDDGFCAFLNGQPIASLNCPESVVYDEVASRAHDVKGEELFVFSRDVLRVGENVLAIAAYNRATSRDFTIIPRVFHRRLLDPPTPPGLFTELNELSRGDGAGNGWVEIFNGDETVPLDLSGASLTDDRVRLDPFVFADQTILGPREFLVIHERNLPFLLSGEEVRLFLLDRDGTVITAHVFDSPPPSELPGGSFSEARFPDGGRSGWVSDTPTPGEPNRISRVKDIVINEIYYHPPENRAGEFLELYHRGPPEGDSIDLTGFRFDNGVDYTFPEGTVMNPGDYLVVARNPDDLVLDHGFDSALGPWVGQLSNRGENVRLVDAVGNLVDEVRYFDGGRWSIWADGRGSSLELIDPRQDNDFPDAWGASDESQTASWEEFSYVVPEYQVNSDSEFHLFLPERGVCLVDDLEIRELNFEKTVIIDEGEHWKYRLGTEPFSNEPLEWTDADFDDSGWVSGPSSFGQGYAFLGTTTGVDAKFSSIALRKTFGIPEGLLGSGAGFALGVDYDSGFCAFLNGTVFARRNCPVRIAHDSRATASRSAGLETRVEIPEELLRQEGNVLAIIAFKIIDAPTARYKITPRLLEIESDAPGPNQFPDPGFESENSTSNWRIEGTHRESRRITSDSHSGDACLEMVATSKGDTLCNRLEVDIHSVSSRRAYEITLWTRWQRGTNVLIAHGQFSSGPWFTTRDSNMSANSLSASLRMTVPRDLGTPGEENSLRLALREATGSDNLGPVIRDVRHSPSRPVTGLPVRVEARISDSDGVAVAEVFFKSDSEQDFQSVELFDDGAHQDGEVADDLYSAQIPGFGQNESVAFYVEVTDTLGAVRRFPTRGPEEPAVYVVQEVFDDEIHIAMTASTLSELRARPTHSNALVNSTITFRDESVYYNVGVRYRGSPWGRPARNAYRLRFNKDKPFVGGVREMNLTNHDSSHDGPAYYIIGRLGTHEKPIPVANYRYITARVNDRTMGAPGYYEPVGGNFLERWYGAEGTQGIVCLKGIGRHRFNDSCDLSTWDETSLIHRLDDPENYRHYWRHSVDQTRDDWEGFIGLTEVLDPNHTPDAELEALLPTVLDVESFFRVLAARVVLADWDALYIGNGHNGYMVQDPRDGLWELLPFDFGAAFSSSTPDLLDVRDFQVQRLLSHPPTLRLYYRLIESFIEGPWTGESVGPYLDALQRSIASTGGGAKNFVRNSGNSVRTTLEDFTNVPFAITTNGGQDFVVDGSAATIQGRAPVRIAELLVSVDGAQPEAVPVEWSDSNNPTRWRIEVDLAEVSTAHVDIHGVDDSGVIVETLRVGVTQGPGANFLRGDVLRDGALDLTDVMAGLFHLFHGFPVSCADAIDVDDNGVLEIVDSMALLRYLYLSGEPPAEPFPVAGPDHTEDGLVVCR